MNTAQAYEFWNEIGVSAERLDTLHPQAVTDVAEFGEQFRRIAARKIAERFAELYLEKLRREQVWPTQ